MSKLNINFNDKNYSFDADALSEAKSAIKSHLLSTMAGTGATIEFDGVEYSLDVTKLSAAENNFAAYLDTISGEAPTDERLEGDGSEYYTLAPTALSFRSTAPLNEFNEVQINGVTVDPSNYTLEEGSTIVTFPVEYLRTLNVGNYEVAVASNSKTVKGNFTVAAPDLNEHGFYYNQPYSANLPMFGGIIALFVREDNTYDIITVGRNPDTGEYTFDGNVIVATHPMLGTLHCTISSDGKSIYCAETGADFVLSNDISIVSDEDYIYMLNENGYYYVNCAIDKTKSSYSPIRTGINGLSTKYIASNAFLGCVNLTSIIIPSCIEFIFDNAFGACFNLDEVIIENCKVYIDGNPFPDSPLSKGISIKHSYFKSDYVCDICKHCEHLHAELVGKTDEYSGDVICNDCGKTVTKGGYYIPAGATYYVARTGETLTEGDIFPTISNLSKNDIYNDGQCKYTYGGQSWSLTDANQDVSYVSIAESINNHRVTSIGDNAFNYCENLESVTIPDSVTSIGDWAFYSCAKLTSINIPDSVTSIGVSAFRYCSGLLKSENNVYYVNQWVVGVENYNIASASLRIDTVGICHSAFDSCSNLTSVTIPDSVTTISVEAFRGCTNLVSVTIGNAVTTISYSAFNNCSGLTSITIPNSVTSIEDWAFAYCDSLTSITFNGAIAQWNAITKGNSWKYNVPATHVQCTDGTVALQ